MSALVAPLAAQGHGHEQTRTAVPRVRSDARFRSDDHQRVGDRGQLERGRLDRGRVDQTRVVARTDVRGRVGVPAPAFRGRIDDRWRDANALAVHRYFSSSRNFNAFYRYRAALPFGWDRRVYLNAFFPVDYDVYLRPVPADLDYLLPPIYDGYARFVFGDRLVVMDRLSRRVVVMVPF